MYSLVGQTQTTVLGFLLTKNDVTLKQPCSCFVHLASPLFDTTAANDLFFVVMQFLLRYSSVRYTYVRATALVPCVVLNPTGLDETRLVVYRFVI